MEDIKAYKVKITGDVQGVFYRHNAQKVAKKLNLTGYIKNKQDGSVLAVIQGGASNTEEFIKWCYEGSPMATVENVEIEVIEIEEKFNNFEIR